MLFATGIGMKDAEQVFRFENHKIGAYFANQQNFCTFPHSDEASAMPVATSCKIDKESFTNLELAFQIA
ncbi:MAG: hypothetical protein KME19_12555 [Microcoleus vaginatus WJT46-NPBG5]|jgi:hypothetical protein|nr:hypothetical protein [Microcoleus vaginatus WJT46-NPBG5]